MTPPPPLPERDDFKCRSCGRCPSLVQNILDPLSGRTVRLFRCECGERAWDND